MTRPSGRQAIRLPYNCYCDAFLNVVTLPGAALPALCVLRSASMKMNSSGGAAQINCVLCPAALTLLMFRLNRVPEPDSGAKSFE